MGLRLDVIVRVSKKGGRENLNSPKQQERDCRRWADAHGHEIAMVHVAIDESAGHGSHPAIEAAKARALNGDTNGCVAAYLSRSFRHTMYGLQTVKELLDAGRHFFALDCPFDLSTPDGEKYLTDKLAQAQYEWRMYKQNFDRNVAEAIARGVHINVPYGYQRSAGRGTPLALNEAEWPTVKHAAECRALGWSWPRIARELNATWAPPRPTTRTIDGDKVTWQAQWNHTTVHQMLGQEVYRGYAYSGVHHNPEAHPVIINDALWAQVKAHRGTSRGRTNADEYELTGLVRCSGCGYAMVHNPNHLGHRSYRCTRRGAGKCPAPVCIPAPALEEAVMKQFAAEYLTEAATGERTAEGEAEAQAEVDAANAAMQAVVDSWVRVREVTGTLTPDQAARETRDIRAASERATAAEGELHRVRATNRGHELLGELTIRTFAEAPAEERRRYMSLMYRAVVCRPAARWREPVTDRYVILRTVGQAPTYGVPLIREVIELGK